MVRVILRLAQVVRFLVIRRGGGTVLGLASVVLMMVGGGYDTLQTDSKKPLYLGCKNSLTLLVAVLSLVNVKAKYGWSDKNFTSLLKVMHDMLPEENTLSKSYYEAKKILSYH